MIRDGQGKDIYSKVKIVCPPQHITDTIKNICCLHVRKIGENRIFNKLSRNFLYLIF